MICVCVYGITRKQIMRGRHNLVFWIASTWREDATWNFSQWSDFESANREIQKNSNTFKYDVAGIFLKWDKSIYDISFMIYFFQSQCSLMLIVKSLLTNFSSVFFNKETLCCYLINISSVKLHGKRKLCNYNTRFSFI